MFTIILLTMIGFGILHSLLAGNTLKEAIRQRLGERIYEGFYRIGYNFVAFATLIPILMLVVVQPGRILWQIEGIGQGLTIIVQVAGVAGVVISLLQIDLWRFAGVKQVTGYFAGDTLPLADEALQMGGLYGVVRHPLYFFSLLAMWPMSTMTEALLAFNIASTAYFVLGSVLEERKLVRVYGDIYRHYQQHVSWLIPLPRPRL